MKLKDKKEMLQIQLEDIPALKLRTIALMAFSVFWVVVSMWFIKFNSSGLPTVIFTITCLYFMFGIYRCNIMWHNLLNHEHLLKKKQKSGEMSDENY
jgi:hypothetical protein